MSEEIYNLSPIDGRYANKTREFVPHLSEYGLIRYRLLVEWNYLLALRNEQYISDLNNIPESYLLQKIESLQELSLSDALKIKEIEKTTNHDVKAVEYFIKDQLEKDGYSDQKEWVHFALTSQDINNTAIPMSITAALKTVLIPALDELMEKLFELCEEWFDVPMLARTHGQPASPTRLGKEIYVFYDRLKKERSRIDIEQLTCKFGGATGNFNAHHVSFPEKDWMQFGNVFCEKYLGLKRLEWTTQIDHYDELASVFHHLLRINTILIDACRDIWSYISIEYFKQKTVKNEVGSSAMPHKVNPIDFENAEGNFGLANAICEHLASKLPVSRWQRDLTDSTVLRNISLPLAHSLIAYRSMIKGLGKLQLNQEKIASDLGANVMVISEAIQNILRREKYPNPYEALKSLTRGNANVSLESIHEFIETLEVSEKIRTELRSILPHNYIGIYPEMKSV